MSTHTSSCVEAITLPVQDQEFEADYWNIEAFLAEEEKVPSRFKVDAKGLSYLTSQNSTVS